MRQRGSERIGRRTAETCPEQDPSSESVVVGGRGEGQSRVARVIDAHDGVLERSTEATVGVVLIEAVVVLSDNELVAVHPRLQAQTG